MTIEQQYIYDTVCECIVQELELQEPIDGNSLIADIFHSDETWYATIERISYEFTIDLPSIVIRSGTVGHLCAIVERHL